MMTTCMRTIPTVKRGNFGQKNAFFRCFSPITLAILVFSQFFLPFVDVNIVFQTVQEIFL